MGNQIIMLVDDNEIDNFINKRMLELNGFQGNYIIKNSGYSALEYFKDNHYNLTKIPDILFLDINMPIVDGHAFLYQFDELPETIKEKCKIVILSSSDFYTDVARFSKDDNVKGFISKPLTPESLEKIKLILKFKTTLPLVKNA